MEFFGALIIIIIAVGFGFFIGRQMASSKQNNEVEIELKTTNQNLQKQIDEKDKELQKTRTKAENLTGELAQAKEQTNAHQKAQKQAKTEFENLANKILKTTGEDFKQQSEETLKNLLNPLDTQLKDFKTEITGFKAINNKMTLETESLTKALTSNVKIQGNWGEFTLERILEQSGLTEGREYNVQGKGLDIKNVDGGRQMPDVIINLPEEKHIVIDSKVSLKDFVDYQAAQDETAREMAVKNFITSTRNHIKGLQSKNYQNAYGLKSLNFVMMFMPIEASYFLLMQEREDLIAEAWDKNIALVCPSTLLPNLRTIAYLWRLQKQNENADEIARLGGTIYDKIHGFLSNMETVGKAIDNAQKKHDEALKQLSGGRGNVLTQAEKLKEMGAKTQKTLPQNLLED
ncbi:MAG: DNA recombination protein RmuC [Parvibaculales bacterium]